MTLGPTRAAGAGRPSRQAPTDLTISFADEAAVRHQSTALREPKWLLDERLAALAMFRDLPIESQVLYTTYVDLRNARLGEVRPLDVDSKRPSRAESRLPAGAAGLIEIDQHGRTRLTVEPEAARRGVVLEDLGQLLGRDPARAREVLTRETLPKDDKLAQLTRALWSRGVHVSVPSGVRLERPIVVRWVGAPAGSALLTRTFVELGSDAEAKVVEELESGSAPAAGAASAVAPAQALFTGTTEVHLGAGSNLSVASLQDFGLDQVAFHHRVGIIGRRATLHWALAQLGSRLVRSRVDNRLEGDGSSVEQVEIVFGSSDQLFDLTSYTRHVGRDATSNLLSKAVLQDGARTFLKGLVTIEKSAIGTDSFLGEYGMNLSKKARAVAIPSLEIDQPDCRRVMHSSSVGPIDDTQLFYLESRGIPPDEARKFIVLGFLEPVVARVPLESAEARLRELLETKWDAGHEGAAAA